MPFIDLRPSYSYWLMNQIAEHLKTEKYNVYSNYFNNILNVCSRLMKIENLPWPFLDDMDVNFVGVKRRILDIVQALIQTHQKDFPLDYKDQVWEIIEYLCYYEFDPIDEPKKDDSGMDPITTSMNSVRGSAMHTLIDYALWYAFHTKELIDKDLIHPNRLKGEERILNLLETKLSKANDKSLAIHSTFGLFFANLASLN